MKIETTDHTQNGSNARAKKCSFATLGCKVNQYETQALREILLGAGYEEVPLGEPCDLCVINTCAVTSGASRKSRKHIHRAIRANPGAVVAVTGCLADVDKESVEAIPGVSRVVPKADAGDILRIAGEDDVERGAFQISRFGGHTRAFLKIQDGCEAFCSYCIVPYARGQLRSRDRDDIRREAERLVAAGHREIVLTGIHLGLYGAERDNSGRLEDVVEELLSLNGLERLRLSSIEMGEVSDRLLELIAGDEKLCPHLHIPLQSGDDEILRAMNRRYSSSEFLAALDRIRGKAENPSLTSDVMVGFPGEGEEQFRNTLSVCRRAVFSRLHVFRFSPREGTRAAEMPGRIAERIAKEREAETKRLGDELALEYKRGFIGRVVMPLVEHDRDRKTGRLCGYTERYMKVIFDGGDELAGRIVNVSIDSCDARAMYGSLSAAD